MNNLEQKTNQGNKDTQNQGGQNKQHYNEGRVGNNIRKDEPTAEKSAKSGHSMDRDRS